MTQSANYAVVKFIDEFDSDNNPLVELVPQSWIVECGDNLQCFWPPSHSLKNIRKFVEEQKLPETRWKKYPIEILTTAATHSKGLKRLKRSLKRTTSLNSSGTESESTNTLVLSNETTRRLLNISTNLSTLTEEEDDVRSTGDNEQPEAATSHQHQSMKERVQTLRGQANNDLRGFIADYIDSKHGEIISTIVSAKRSIQYDLNKKLEDLKLSILMESRATTEKRISPRETLEVTLPIKTLDDFLTFESTLNPDENGNPGQALEKQKALKSLYELITSGSDDYKTDIKLIIPKIIAKAIQLEYSGAGRAVKGISKKNFSKTMVYQCLEDFLREKHRHSGKELNILSTMSRYLSGAGDREGGYAERRKQ